MLVVRRSLLAAILGVSLLLPSTLAQPQAQESVAPAPAPLQLADLMGEQTLLYLRFAGFDESARIAADSHLRMLLTTHEMRAFAAPFLQMLGEVARDVPGPRREGWAAAKRALGGAIEIGVRGSTIIWDQRGNPKPLPSVLVGIDLGEQPESREAELLQVLKPIVGSARGRAIQYGDFSIARHQVPIAGERVSIFRTRVQNTLVLALNRFALQEAIDRSAGKGRSLRDLAGLRRGRELAAGAAVLEVYANTQVLTQAAGPFIPDEVRYALGKLGLDGVAGVYWASGVADREAYDLIFIDSPEPHTGLLALGTEKPLSSKIYSLAPKGSMLFAAGRMDLAGLFDLVMDLGEDILPSRMMRMARGGVGMAGGALGVDLRRDLLGSLGNEAAIYAGMTQGRLYPEVGILLEVTDRQKIERILKRAFGMGNIGIESRVHASHEIWHLEIPLSGIPVSPCLAFVGDYLAISASRSGLEGVIARQQGTADGLLASAAFQEAVKPTAWKEARGLLFFDAKRIAGYYYDVAINAAPGLLQGMDLPVDVHALPSAESMLRHVRSQVVISRPTAHGPVIEARGPGLGAVLATAASFVRDLPVSPLDLGPLMLRLSPPRIASAESLMRPLVVRAPEPLEEPEEEIIEEEEAVEEEIVEEEAVEVAPSAGTATTIVNPLPQNSQESAQALARLRAVQAQIATSPKDGRLHFAAGIECIRLGHAARAAQHFERAYALNHNRGTSSYNLACAHSLAGNTVASLAALRQAFEAKWWNERLLKQDSDLDNLRKHPEFRQLLEEFRPR